MPYADPAKRSDLCDSDGCAERTRWSILEPMRDGIYKVDFKVGRPEGHGIAMVRNGVFRGIDQTHVYVGQFDKRGEKLSGRIAVTMYTSPRAPAVFYMSDYTLKLNGEESETGFVLSGHSEADARSRHECKGKWIAEL